MNNLPNINFEIQCPHCKDYIIIEKINCGIFRHGVIKSTLIQINPHLEKDKCEKLKNLDLIYGCGKPFKIINENNKWIAVVCEYI